MLTSRSDQAITAEKSAAMGYEPTYSGVLSLFRRVYSKELTGCDLSLIHI